MTFNNKIENELKLLHNIDTNMYNIPNVLGIKIPTLRLHLRYIQMDILRSTVPLRKWISE